MQWSPQLALLTLLIELMGNVNCIWVGLNDTFKVWIDLLHSAPGHYKNHAITSPSLAVTNGPFVSFQDKRLYTRQRSTSQMKVNAAVRLR